MRRIISLLVAVSASREAQGWLRPIIGSDGQPLGFNFGGGGGADLPNGAHLQFGGGGGIYFGPTQEPGRNMSSVATSLKEFAASYVDDVDSFLKTWSRFVKSVSGIGAETAACRMQHVEFTALTGVSACVQACNSPALANLALMREGPCDHEAGVVREEVKLPITHGSFTSQLAAVVTIKKVSQDELRQREVAKKVVAEGNTRYLAAVISQGHNFDDVSPAIESLSAISDGWQDLRYSWYNLVRYVTGDRKAQLQAQKHLSPVDAIIADAESWIDFAVKLNAAFVHESPDQMCARVSILKTDLCAEVCLSPSLVKLTTFLQAECPPQYVDLKVVDLNVQGMHFGVTVKAREKPHASLRSLQSQSPPSVSAAGLFDKALDVCDSWAPIVRNVLDDERRLMRSAYDGDFSATWDYLSSMVAGSVPLLKCTETKSIWNNLASEIAASTMRLYMVVSPRQGAKGVCLRLSFQQSTVALSAILLPVSTVVSCGEKVYESRVIAVGDYHVYVDVMTLLDSAVSHVAAASAVESDFDWKAYDAGFPQTSRLASRLEPGSWYNLPQGMFPDPKLTRYGQQWPMLKNRPETEPIVVEKATGPTTKDRWGDNVQELKTEQTAPSQKSVESGNVKPGSWYNLPQGTFPDPKLTQYGQQWPMLKDRPETEPIVVEKATGPTTKDRWGDNVQELKTEQIAPSQESNVPHQRQLRALPHEDASEKLEMSHNKRGQSDKKPENPDEKRDVEPDDKSDKKPEMSHKKHGQSDKKPKNPDEKRDVKPDEKSDEMLETKPDEHHQHGGLDYSKYIGGQQGGSPQQGDFDYSKYVGGQPGGQQGGSPQQGGFDYSKYIGGQQGGSPQQGGFDYSKYMGGQQGGSPQQGGFDYSKYIGGQQGGSPQQQGGGSQQGGFDYSKYMGGLQGGSPQQGGFDYSKYIGGQQGGSPQQGGFDHSKYMGGQQGGSSQQGGFDYSKYMNGALGFFDYSTGSHEPFPMSWTPQMKSAFDYDSFMDGGSNISQSAYRQNIEPHFNHKTRDAVLQQFMDEYDHYIRSQKFTHHKQPLSPPPAYQELVHEWVTM
ncbi:MAG: uncharacterized protein KVP18_004823 [Porospora cf. gigantea A]|uniref:uncharacterized protein n=1 Tax=Porospora cf. gigantea A TaxID=2853593 RepID=UPI003559934D|nr:MAG: hypothetical protein KVP18_004823 [Porospora cf. gigantea A]